jgi:hypothetical protein
MRARRGILIEQFTGTLEQGDENLEGAATQLDGIVEQTEGAKRETRFGWRNYPAKTRRHPAPARNVKSRHIAGGAILAHPLRIVASGLVYIVRRNLNRGNRPPNRHLCDRQLATPSARMVEWTGSLACRPGLLAKIAGAEACRDSRMPLSGTLCAVDVCFPKNTSDPSMPLC